MENPNSQDNEDPDPARDEILNLPPFQYPPLPSPTSIRLLEVLRSTNDDTIRCTMTTVDLASYRQQEADNSSESNDKRPTSEEPPLYAALSYTWNDPITIYEEPARPIVNNPQTDEEHLLNPYVFVIKALGSLIVHTDFALKSYLETHPYLPKEMPQPPPEPEKDEMKAIEVDGHLLYVQENLYDFLQYFHHLKFQSDLALDCSPTGEDDATRHVRKCVMAPLWIDAVCINQADTAERASQVQMMDRVYQNAARVFGWVGYRDTFSQKAMDTIDVLYDVPEEVWDGGNLTLSSFPEVDLVHWFALYAFFQRSWFRRAWVVQEATFGRGRVDIVHDHRIYSWRYLATLAQDMKSSGLALEVVKLGRKLCNGWGLSDSIEQIMKVCDFGDERDGEPEAFRRAYTEGQDGFSFMASIEDQMWRFKDASALDTIFTEPPPLIRVLSLFRGTDATDPRDKIFAFLNLASDRNDLSLVPDYNDDVKTLQEPCDTRVEGWMGWVPDFSAHLKCVPLDYGDDDVVFAASGRGTKAPLRIHGDGSLEVESIMVDKVVLATVYEDDIEDLLISILKLLVRLPHDYPMATFATAGEHMDGTFGITFQLLGRTSVDPLDDDEEADLADDRDTAVARDFAQLAVQDQPPKDDNEPTSSGPMPNSAHDRRKHRIDSTTRIEALWRSLVGNMLPKAGRRHYVDGTKRVAYPAPTSLGVGFSNWMMAHILEMSHMIQGLGYSEEMDEDKNKESEQYKETPGENNKHNDPTENVQLHMSPFNDYILPIEQQPPDIAPDRATRLDPANDSNEQEQEHEHARSPAAESTDTTPNQAHPGQQLAERARQRFALALALYTAVYNKIHIPVTPSTRKGFTIPEPELGILELAAREQLTTETPSPNTSESTAPIEPTTPSPSHAPPYLPSASALLSALTAQPPPYDTLASRNGTSPQASLDGQWWEMALSQFTPSERDGINTFEKRMRSIIAGRRVFITSNGLIGVGPRSSLTEDGWVYEVHVLKGGKVPYVLARNPWEEEAREEGEPVRYRVIGEAYVHEIMDGEVHSMAMAGGEERGWAEYKEIRLV